MNAWCPVCDACDASPVYQAAGQPVLLNELFPTRVAALRAPRIDLDFRGCRCCGFVWNAAFDPEAIEYLPGYINDQSQSPRFRSHLAGVIDQCARAIESVDGCILEIGCGQ